MNAGLKHAALLLWLGAPWLAAAAAEPEGSADAARSTYEDRLIDGGSLTADVFNGAEIQDGSGWSRSYRLEAITSRVSRGDFDQDESGLRLSGMLDTPNLGAFTLDANIRTSQGQAYGSDTGNRVTLFQLGMPMNGGWRVNNALGVTNTPSVDLARQQQRFWVPSLLQNGLTTEWRSSSGLQLHASVGRPGLLTGLYVPTFEGLGGEQASAGAQWNGANGWSAALQAVKVQDVRLGLGPLNASRVISGHAGLGSLAWGTADRRVQLSAVASAEDKRADGFGAWIDGAIRGGRVQHTFGVFRFDELLSWGNQPLTSNYQGGYYRAGFQSRQWVIDGGLDYVEPVVGNEDPTLFATAYARKQWTSRTGVGGGVNVRQNGIDAWSTFGFIDHSNRLGVGRVQADHSTDDLQDRTQLTFNQTWNMPAGTRLGNSFIFGRETLAGRSMDVVGIAVNGGGDLLRNLSVDLDARWDHSSGREQANNVLVNFVFNWMIAPGWSLGATYYISRNSWRSPLDVSSPIEGPPLFDEQRTNDRGYFVTLRREWQAGSRSVPLGGIAGSGSGNIEGVMFFDANDNGLLDAGETGTPNVVILLNGRFAARTNAEGRFDFPSVAAGAHVLTVVPDNLPLPWAVRDDGRTSITVGVRQRTFVAIGAQRQR